MVAFFSSCDSHNWDDDPKKGPGSKHLFKRHGEANSHDGEANSHGGEANSHDGEANSHDGEAKPSS